MGTKNSIRKKMTHILLRIDSEPIWSRIGSDIRWMETMEFYLKFVEAS
jgi:hypothetical protein